MLKILSALVLTALLAGTINTESLWTDEAFSAFIASHHSIAACWSTLVTGDSSDLQMVLYYLYLHCWSQVFGQSEVAFRTANVPFILLYSGVLVWAAQRLFHSRWLWIIAGLAPLAFVFASDTRPYFDVIALSLTGVTCLLAYLQSPSIRERQVLPWLALLSILTGAAFHMLTLLLGPPLVVMLALFYFADKKVFRWHDWKWPLICLVPVGCGMLAYFAWTFGRGASYDYARPDLLSMASVVFRFSGLSGYAPNRRYDIAFRPFLPAMALATITFASGFVALFLAPAARDRKLTFKALCYALATGLAEICVLSYALHEQIEFRHLSCLLPLLMLLILAGLSGSRGKYMVWAAAAFGMTWLVSDIRLLAPEFKREDFRSAVRKSIALHADTGGAIAVAADPIGAAYYGLRMQGATPCFPLTDSCQEGFAKVPWAQQAPADYAMFWSAPQIAAWAKEQERSNKPMVLLMCHGRHPSCVNSPWWPFIGSRPHAQLFTQQGFFVYLIH